MTKKSTRTATIIGLAGALVAGAAGLQARVSAAPAMRPPVVVPQQKESKIQIAILLDTSSSMDGLIEQAKSQLWKIVNQAAGAKTCLVTSGTAVPTSGLILSKESY